MNNRIIKNIEIISAILLGVLPIGLIIGTAVSETIIIFVNILFLIVFLHERNFFLIKKKEILYLMIIWIYLLINCLAANNSQLALSRSVFFFRYILLIMAISHLFKNINYQKIIFIIWSIIISIVTFDIYYEFFSGKNILGYISADETRIVSFMKDELRIGSLVLAFFLIVINFWNIILIEKKISLKFQYLIYGLEILILIGIFLTGERAVTFKALICFIFLIFSKEFKHKILIIISILSIPLALFFSSEHINQRYTSSYVELFNNKKILYNSLHAAHYDAALTIFKKYPLLGVGNKNFRVECQKEIYANDKFEKTSSRCSTHPHQIYFEILSELGLIGFFLIFIFIFINIYKAISIYLQNKNLILLSSILYLVSFLIPLIPSGSFFSSFNATVFWINFSIMLSFIINQKKQQI